jgi:hypothetical protein
MTALITELIKVGSSDTSEIVRDQIAAILLTEIAEQQVLAAAADPAQDPDDWKLRIFLECSNPWDQFQDATAEDDEIDESPIVNVGINNIDYAMNASNIVARQKATAVYHIDCYGYGKSADATVGHDLGDVLASLNMQRAVRLVRNILMAGAYTYLGFPRGAAQFVWRRWIQSVTMFQPQIDGRHVQEIQAARIAFQVEFNEFSPQVQGEEIELISTTVRSKETGELLLRADYTQELS